MQIQHEYFKTCHLQCTLAKESDGLPHAQILENTVASRLGTRPDFEICINLTILRTTKNFVVLNRI